MASSRKCGFSSGLIDDTIVSCLERYTLPGQHLFVAYSGGLDSTALLDALVQSQPRHGRKISAIHFHHGVSSKADEWVEHCVEFCRVRHVPLKVERLFISAYQKTGFEAAARALRYASLKQLDADWVCVGHHACDQAETVLLNLLRGSGVLGLAGIPQKRGKILRPLHRIERDQLFEYAKSRGLDWCEDESNQDHSYTRNYIRHVVLPILESKFPAAARQLAATAERMAEAQSLLADLARIDAGDTLMEFPFPCDRLSGLPPVRAANLLRTLLSANHLQCPPEPRLREFIRQVLTYSPDRHPELRVGVTTLRVNRKQIEKKVG